MVQVGELDAYLEWQERLKRVESSGLSIDVFCQREDVRQSTFVEWLRVLKSEQQRQAEEIRSPQWLFSKLVPVATTVALWMTATLCRRMLYPLT
jgi:hypothetical protein